MTREASEFDSMTFEGGRSIQQDTRSYRIDWDRNAATTAVATAISGVSDPNITVSNALIARDFPYPYRAWATTIVGPDSDQARAAAEYVRLEYERLTQERVSLYAQPYATTNMTVTTDTASPAPSIDLEAKAARMLAIRDARSRLKAEYDKHDAIFTAELEQIELEVRGHLSAQNVKSVRTNAGTIMLQESQRFWPSDWEAFYAFVHQHAAYHLLERRIHNTHMAQFLESNPGEYPAGLNVDREVKAVVRKAT